MTPTRIIIVSELQPAALVGTCNACTNRPALVHEVQLRMLTFRLCRSCARHLAWALSGENERGVIGAEEEAT